MTLLQLSREILDSKRVWFIIVYYIPIPSPIFDLAIFRATSIPYIVPDIPLTYNIRHVAVTVLDLAKVLIFKKEFYTMFYALATVLAYGLFGRAIGERMRFVSEIALRISRLEIGD